MRFPGHADATPVVLVVLLAALAVVPVPPGLGAAADLYHGTPLAGGSHLPAAAVGPRGTAPPAPAASSLGPAPLPLPTGTRGASPRSPLPAPAPCAALSDPFGGASALPPGCYAHDSAFLGFYSDRVGSGANVTWEFTLPLDGGATQNQSDLYEAAWFGIPLAASAAWTGVCYLEVQLFPDTSWTAPYHASDSWAVAEVGWQVDPATGREDTCTASPMYADGSGAPLVLNGGDRVALAFRGTEGGSAGENVTLTDASAGVSSSFTAQNASSGAPLPPLDTRSAPAPSVGWAPAGFPAAAMGFEVGRGAASPANNSFGGCDPGPPPASSTDPAVPCASYDPASWLNDTLAPWQIGTPTFEGPGGSSTPTQVEFASSVGGPAVLTAGSNGACTARLGSAYCSYPWFSYSCGAGAFEFGATDFAGVSTDFGKAQEYNSNLSTSPLGTQGYLPYGAGIPACGLPTGSLSIATVGNGTVEALGVPVANGTNVTDLSPGAYALAALPANGSGFLGWSVSGPASLSAPEDPSTTVLLAGNATLTAEFGSGASSVTLQLTTSSGDGGVVLVPLDTSDPVNLSTTVASGASASLDPGRYSLQDYPAPGERFANWTVSGPATLSASAQSPTILDLRSGGSTVRLEAVVAPSKLPASVEFGGSGNGTVELNGTTATYAPATRTSSGVANLTPGSYALAATPAPGWTFVGWSTLPSALLTDRRARSNVTVGPGPASLIALFAAVVELNVSPGGGGRISVADAPPASNGTEVALLPGNYSLDAVAFAGYGLSRWSVSDPSALWVARPGSPHTRVQVNATGIVSAQFTPRALENVTFVTSPSAGGWIQFNFLDLYTGTQQNASLTNSSYTVKPIPAYGFRFVRWNVSGPLNVSGGVLSVHGPGGVLRAEFATRLFPVTFTLAPASLVAVAVDGSPVANGQTLELVRGAYALAASVAPNTTFLGWSSALSLANVSASGPNATLELRGPGSVAALAAPFVLASLSADRSQVDVGHPVDLLANVSGPGPFQYAYRGLPPGCVSVDAPALRCVPSAAGPYRVSVLVTASTGATLLSEPIGLNVRPLPSVTLFSATPALLDTGQPVTFGVQWFGGSGPFRFAYAGLPAGCTSANASALTCSPSAAGGFRVSVSVSDAFGEVGYANRTLTVNPAPSAPALTPTPSEVTLGIATRFAATVTGGTAPFSYRYSGSVPGCGLPETSSFNCTPSATGTFPVAVVVEDATGANVSAQGVLVVNPVPTVQSFSASPSTLALGEVVTFVVAVVGGTAPFNYTYSGLPPGCVAGDNATFDCAPSSAGSFEVTVHAADVFGVATGASVHVTVNPGTAPPGSSASPLDPLWVLLAVLVAVDVAASVIVYQLWRRRRAPRPRPPLRGR